MPATTPDATMAQFTDLVNMGAEELEAWLATPESGSVGITHEGESESQGVKSGRQIVKILRKLQASQELDEAEVAHCAKVVGYIRRHKAQGHRMNTKTRDELEHARWTCSLKNWGHDPLLDEDVGELLAS